MKTILRTNAFKKDLKRVINYKGYKKEKLSDYVNKLANSENLPANAKDHKLSPASPKEYHTARDFHLSPDIVVVYKRTDDAIELLRIGKHNDLGLTENISISS